MDAPTPTTHTPPPPARFTRRRLLKFVGGACALGLGAEFLRVVAFTNAHTVLDGRVYRTAQLTPDQLRSLIADKGIRTVVNLRGVCANMPWYLDECRVTHAAGVSQEDVTLSAKRFPAPGEVRRLVEILDHTAYPILLHCQRGADRTGLAATAAVLLHTPATLAEARRQLWPRYGHVPFGRTQVMDGFFDYYAAWLAARGEEHAPDRFRRWVNTDYCPGPYRANLSVVGPTSFPDGRGFVVVVRAVNTSIEPWTFTTGGAGGIRLQHTLTDVAGVTRHKAHVGHFARTVAPGEHIDLACGLPPQPAGAYPFHADLVDGQPIGLLDTGFVQYGSEPLAATVTVG
ncbi:MAG: tyrosine-protein phosphatase [Gemmataceae bacterium]|nr:tyrosine-protein phosphatase [Gemmataceae bacterium]